MDNVTILVGAIWAISSVRVRKCKSCWPKNVVKGCVIETATHATFEHVFLLAEYTLRTMVGGADGHDGNFTLAMIGHLT